MRFSFPRIIFALALAIPGFVSAENWRSELKRELKNGGAYAVDAAGREVFSSRERDLFIPASTLKVATIFAAIETLGSDYRFPTEFLKGPDGSLIVKGYGDPLLISEELEVISSELANELKSINNIILDDSYFAADLSLDGVEGSTNPYDAQNGSLIANFNTVYLRRLKSGVLESAEPQTPLVPLAARVRTIRKGTEERFNLGFDRTLAVKYFGELLRAFLEKRNVQIRGGIQRGRVPAGSKVVYVHRCPKTLYELAQHILEYSTNFGANQIFLALGAKEFSPPATYEKGSRVVSAFLREKLGLTDFTIIEGSGLSRQNRFSAKELVRLIEAFRPHESLLPLKEDRYRAKTGSLTGVNSLAGSMDVPGRGRVTFAFVVNSVVPFRHKYYLADLLYRGLVSEKEN